MLEILKREVMAANKEIDSLGLAKLTWGNVSGIDRKKGLVVIKPSGVAYAKLRLQDMVVVDLDGKVKEGKLRPSVDTSTHLLLYRAFPNIGAIVHTHSLFASSFCQAMREIPCLGTTHADHFLGPVPLTRNLTPAEINDDYEYHTGMVILERFQKANPPVDAADMPAVLVAHHAPFIWGKNPSDAMKNAVALETVAEMALNALALNPVIGPLPKHNLDTHYQRKHGPNPGYGQPG